MTNSISKPTIAWRSKFFATGIHLAVSLVIFLLLAAWLVWQLYPSFYLKMHGGIEGLMLMFGVDVVLGPLLTFLVFNPSKKKREIISDFIIIGLVQIAALGYGLHTVYYERPKLVVMYNSGTGTILSEREVNKIENLKVIDVSKVVRLGQVPLLVHDVKNQQTIFTDAQLVLDKIEKMDKSVRQSMSNEDKQQLVTFEQQYGTVWVLAIMGKYTGAYIVLDKQFNYLGKIGERAIS